MDNQQESLQFNIMKEYVNLDELNLHKKLFTKNTEKLDFISTYCSMTFLEQSSHYNIGRGPLTTIRQKFILYISKLPLPKNFTILPINCDNKYAIDIYGNVIRVNDRYLLNKNIDTTGYFRVELTYELNGILQKYARLHRLIALTFIPNPENKTQVNHIDGNKLNNDIKNLEWCTPKENIRHAIDTGLAKQKYKKEKRPYRRKLTDEQIIEIKKSLSSITHVYLANKYNVSESTIASIRKL